VSHWLPQTRAVAAHGLDTSLLPPGEPLQTEWNRLLAESREHRLMGMLSHVAASGWLPTTSEQVEDLAEHDEAWQQQALEREVMALAVGTALESAGVDYRLFKGPALARTVYAEPEQRVFADIDILIPGGQLPLARQTLVAAVDAVDVMPEVRPGFDAQFAKDILLRADGIEIDLHRSLAAGPFGLRIPVDELFHESSPVPMGSRVLPTLGPLPTFLQVCYNAALGDIPPRLMSLRDVAQVHFTLELQTDEVIAMASHWKGAAVVSRAVHLTWSTLELPPCGLSDWADEFVPNVLDRRLMAASTSSTRSYTRQVASIAAIPGIRAKGRYIRAIVSPSPEYLKARGWTRRAHVSRAVNRLKPRR